MSYNLPKSQQDRIVSTVKQTVRVATTANIATLTSITPGDLTAEFDGVTLQTGDRALLRQQSLASENGIYEYDGTDLVRTEDANDGQAEGLQPGCLVPVVAGSTNAGLWQLTTTSTIIIGDSDLLFNQIGPTTIPATAPEPILLALNESVDGTTATLDLGTIPFNLDAAAGFNIQLEVTLFVTDGTGTATLFDVTSVPAAVTGATLNTTNTSATTLTSGNLTLTSGDRFYQVNLQNDSGSGSDFSFLGRARLIFV